MNIKPLVGLLTAVVRGASVAVLLAVWALGAAWSVGFDMLARLGARVADLAADAIEAVREW
jgi:hypothetical protein